MYQKMEIVLYEADPADPVDPADPGVNLQWTICTPARYCLLPRLVVPGNIVIPDRSDFAT